MMLLKKYKIKELFETIDFNVLSMKEYIIQETTITTVIVNRGNNVVALEYRGRKLNSINGFLYLRQIEKVKELVL